MSSIEKAMDGHTPQSDALDRIKHGDSYRAEQKLDTEGHTIHQINISRLKREGLLIPDRGAHTLAEEYRMIKRPLLFNAFGKGKVGQPHINLVMIVSAISGEGKTFTTLNLAMSIAMERDTTVLIVDSDVIKPSLSKVLGLSENIGLTDLLQNDRLDIGEAIVNTDIPKLKVLPAGQTNAHATELLASRRMKSVAEELSARYTDRIVLFDSPPLLATSQACVLSQPMGQVLLVVEAGKTSQSALKEALDMLDTDKLIGLILNKKPKSFFGQDYLPYGFDQNDAQLKIIDKDR